MKQIIRDLKNTFITNWAVGSGRANGREFLTSYLTGTTVNVIGIEFTLYNLYGDLYWSTDTSFVVTPRQSIPLYFESTGEVPVWLILITIVYVLITIPLFNLILRRLHDFGLSGWNVLWFSLTAFIPYSGLLVILFLFLKKGDPDTNKYGSPVNYDISQYSIEEESAEASEEEF